MFETIVIFNPSARSKKASALWKSVEKEIEETAGIHATSVSGDAREFAQQAVAAGVRRIIAAGGDGTVNEVVNGMAGSNAALGILPLGTMNVFATELGLPKDIRKCWEVIVAGRTRCVDLPRAGSHAFVQMAGAGFDAQAVAQTSWDAKRNLGPLSYLLSAAQVAARKPPRLTVKAGERTEEGSFVLIGNGRHYGGPFPVFPNARLDDGRLDVVVFQRLSHIDLVRYLQGVLFGTHVTMPDVAYFQASELTVTSESDVPVEVDGEVVDKLPVTFTCKPGGLCVLTP